MSHLAIALKTLIRIPKKIIEVLKELEQQAESCRVASENNEAENATTAESNHSRTIANDESELIY